jgi:hypothetical protein
VSQDPQVSSMEILLQEIQSKEYCDILNSEYSLSTINAIKIKARELKCSTTSFSSHYVDNYLSKNLEVPSEYEAWLSIASGTEGVGIHITKNHNDFLIKARCLWKALVINGYIEDEHELNQEFILEHVHDKNHEIFKKLILKKLIKEELKRYDLF